MPEIDFLLISPQGLVFEGPVEMIVTEGREGQLGILPDHIPLTTPLKSGPLKVKEKQKERLFGVYGGFLEVKEDRVVVLARNVDSPGDVALEEVKKEKANLEEALSEKLTDEERRNLEEKLMRAKLQIKIAR